MNFPDRLDYAIASIYSRQAELAKSAGLDPTDYENKSLEAYQKLLSSDAYAENSDLTNKVSTLLEKENRYLDVKVEEDVRYYDQGISPAEWDPDTMLYNITDHFYEKVVLSDDDRKAFPNLADALDAVNQQNAAVRDASYTNTPDTIYNALTKLTRADTTVVSFVNVPSQTSEPEKTVHNLDPLTGKELTLDDVVKDVSGLEDAILETASTSGSITNTDLQRILAEIEAGYVPFVITEKGLYFPYERPGMYFNDPGGKVLVYFDQHPELFKDSFLQKKTEYMFEADEGIAFLDDIDEDGTDETITIDPITGSMYGKDMLIGFRLTIDGNVIEHMLTDEIESYEMFYGFSSLYIAHVGGRCFLYVSVYGEDDEETFEFMLTKTSAQYIDRFDSILRAGCNPNEVLMEHWTELLGTGSFGRYCRLSPDNGSPIPGNDTNFYYKYSYLKAPIFLKAATDFDTVDEAGNIGQKRTVPAGTKLYLYRGDAEATYRDLQTDDGTLLRVKADKTNDWSYSINGIEVDQIFDNLQYAG